uniref:Protein kinase domain-containing protein n=1 Tax=Panagrolaimus davidi TaxID=227884 RepID=A0A914R0Z7_9BILA
MKYRFTSLRVNFYGQGGMFRRNPNNNHGTTTSTHGNDYITHEYENEKVEFDKLVEFDKWEIPINDLLIDKTTKLGSGAFASVYKGYLKGKNPLLENIGNIHFALEMAENRDNEVAIKMLHTHADDESRTELKKEIAFMKTLGYHPHVLSMIGCVSSIYEPLLIVEYCANGDLLTLLRRHKDYILVDPEADCPAQADFCLTIKDLLSFSWQISDGLVYLSSKNFIHRDIACRNVLITKRMVAKISDFGLCRYSQEALYTTKVGKLPIKWMAIEALKLAEFTSKSDVWSYGVLLFELFSVGDTPYPSISPSDMLDFLLQGNRLPKPELCPEELYNMMQTMWDLNPDSRPTFEIIRKNLSAFLEVSSDAYGYIQVSQDYGKFYSKMEFPLKLTENTLEVVDESEVHIMKPLTDSGILIQQINENIGKKDDKDIIEKIDNV